METRTWTLYFATPKYSDCTHYYTMLLEQFDYKPVKDRPLLHDCSRSKLLFAWSHDWTTILSLRKKLSTLHIQIIRLLNQYVLIVLDIELTEKNVFKELGILLMVLYKDFHFVNQRFLNLLNRQHGTQVIYMELRGVVGSWNMRSCLLSFTT